MTVVALYATGVTAETEHAYVGVKKCGRCHKKELYGNQVGAWREGPHAKAYATLGSDRAAEFARERGIEGSPQKADECVGCHVTAHGVDARLIKYDLDPNDSVQCESCHGAGADYRKRSIMSDSEKSIAKGMIEPSADVCLSCHNDDSPSWDPDQYTLPGGGKAGFDYEQAKAKIVHPTPEDVRGRIAEIEEEEKKKKKKR
jgi:hypothetical protein